MAAVDEFQGGVRWNPELKIPGLKMVDTSMFSIGYKKLNRKVQSSFNLVIQILNGA